MEFVAAAGSLVTSYSSAAISTVASGLDKETTVNRARFGISQSECSRGGRGRIWRRAMARCGRPLEWHDRAVEHDVQSRQSASFRMDTLKAGDEYRATGLHLTGLEADACVSQELHRHLLSALNCLIRHPD